MKTRIANWLRAIADKLAPAKGGLVPDPLLLPISFDYYGRTLARRRLRGQQIMPWYDLRACNNTEQVRNYATAKLLEGLCAHIRKGNYVVLEEHKTRDGIVIEGTMFIYEKVD